MKEKIIVPLEAGNATIIPSDDSIFQIVVTLDGIKYEFNSSPAGIDSCSIDGGKIKEYRK